jgi:hypothetical protein
MFWCRDGTTAAVGSHKLCRAVYFETNIPVDLELPKLVWPIVQSWGRPAPNRPIVYIQISVGSLAVVRTNSTFVVAEVYGPNIPTLLQASL